MAQTPAPTNNSTTFTVNLIGETSGEQKFGKFSAKKRLSFNDQLARDNFRRQFLGASPGEPSPRAHSLAEIFCNTLVRLVEAPSWWVDADEGRALEDENVIVEVYDKCLKVEADAREEVAKKTAAARGDLEKVAAEDPDKK